MEFYSYSSVGNKFLLLDLGLQKENVELAKCFNDFSNIHLGIKDNIQKHVMKRGADGLLLLLPAIDGALRKVLVFNADGSYGQFSVNGARCCAYHLLKNSDKTDYTFFVGDILIKAFRVAGEREITVQLSRKANIESLVLRSVEGFFVNVGNPHFIVLQKVTRADFLQLAPLLGKGNKMTGGAVNVSYFWPEYFGSNIYEGLVYERGVGPTLSCGSAALAFTNVLCILGHIGTADEVVIKMPGGSMRVTVLGQAIFQISAEVILYS